MAILMAAMRPQALAGVVLNDIGPELDPTGAQRIQLRGSTAARAYLGRRRTTNETHFRSGSARLRRRRWRAFAENRSWRTPTGCRGWRRTEDRRCVARNPSPPGATQAMWLAFGRYAACQHSRSAAPIPICSRRQRSIACSAKCRNSARDRAKSRSSSATRRAGKPAAIERFSVTRVVSHGVQRSFLRPCERVCARPARLPKSSSHILQRDSTARSRAGSRDRQRPGSRRVGAHFDWWWRATAASLNSKCGAHLDVAYVGNLAEQPAFKTTASTWRRRRRLHIGSITTFPSRDAMCCALMARWRSGPTGSRTSSRRSMLSSRTSKATSSVCTGQRSDAMSDAYRDLPFQCMSPRAGVPAPPRMDAGQLHRLRQYLVRDAAVYEGVLCRPVAELYAPKSCRCGARRSSDRSRPLAAPESGGDRK